MLSSVFRTRVLALAPLFVAEATMGAVTPTRDTVDWFDFSQIGAVGSQAIGTHTFTQGDPDNPTTFQCTLARTIDSALFTNWLVSSAPAGAGRPLAQSYTAGTFPTAGSIQQSSTNNGAETWTITFSEPLDIYFASAESDSNVERLTYTVDAGATTITLLESTHHVNTFSNGDRTLSSIGTNGGAGPHGYTIAYAFDVTQLTIRSTNTGGGAQTSAVALGLFVPEPSSVAMAGAGLLLLTFRRSRRGHPFS